MSHCEMMAGAAPGSELSEAGYLVLPGLLTPAQLAPYTALCEDLLTGRLEAARHTHDLGSHLSPIQPGQHNIPQATQQAEKTGREAVLR